MGRTETDVEHAGHPVEEETGASRTVVVGAGCLMILVWIRWGWEGRGNGHGVKEGKKRCTNRALPLHHDTGSIRDTAVRPRAFSCMVPRDI